MNRPTRHAPTVSFIKLDARGQRCSLRAKNWVAVLDESTDLIWSRQTVSPDRLNWKAAHEDWHWTATPAAPSPGGYAWLVGFDDGDSGWDGQGSLGFVRAVRASQSLDLGTRKSSARRRVR